ncbi:olfactory receptor 11A1-like [Solea solea]|uniref:olfactory receptor 11A1-like n=1 Tax=Solea solea TaxID=90069 RepID=UPI00272C14DC|nr:olfactory receptor 11A1-like [Solea solea]
MTFSGSVTSKLSSSSAVVDVMMSSGGNMTLVTSLVLDGVLQLSDHRWLFFVLFLVFYVFVVTSDSLVLYIICSQRSLHRPMFIFTAALLFNSMSAGTVVYPKLLWDLVSGRDFLEVSATACLGQAFVILSIGGASFMLLATMAFDRYLSICRPLHYAALVSPGLVAALLLLCWLLPAGLVGCVALLSSRLPLCRSRLSRIYCDFYSFMHLSCGGRELLLVQVYSLVASAVTVLLPVLFVLFSYGRILYICLHGSSSFNSKALHTCVPHLLVFINYSLSTGVELLQRRLDGGLQTAPSILSSLLIVLVPTVCNPVVYGLKMKEVFRHVRRLLSC